MQVKTRFIRSGRYPFTYSNFKPDIFDTDQQENSCIFSPDYDFAGPEHLEHHAQP